jgi:hypothetical protein
MFIWLRTGLLACAFPSSPHRQRGECAGPHLLPRAAQEGFDGGLAGDERGDYPVHPGRACPLVAPHPVPRDREEVRVTDEVEQIVKPTAGIFGRPVVQLGLHSLYPLLRPIQVGPRLPGIHQRLQPLQSHRVHEPAGPLRHVRGFPTPGLLRALRPAPAPSADDAPTRPGPHGLRARDGSVGVVPTFTSNRSAGEVPSYAPAASPRLRRSPSPWPPDRR